MVINLQGDEPLMKSEDIKNLNNKMIMSQSKIGTLAPNFLNKDLYENQNVVKVKTSESLQFSTFPEAINVMSKSKHSDANIYHHLGLYCDDIKPMNNSVSLQTSSIEIKSTLEKLRVNIL